MTSMPINSKEELLALWMETEPTARSPYGLYGYPPMWKAFDLEDGLVLFCRPSRIQTKIHQQWHEVDGVSWQWRRDGKWVDQAHAADFDHFLTMLSGLENEHIACATGAI